MWNLRRGQIGAGSQGWEKNMGLLLDNLDLRGLRQFEKKSYREMPWWVEG